ncbi:hypothetical protein DRQ05_05020, partial [bacterium]
MLQWLPGGSCRGKVSKQTNKEKEMRKLVLSAMALLLSVVAANAFIYANDAACEWTDGNGTGLWNVDGNWDNVQGSDYGVPDASGEYACIDSGTA